MSSSGLWQDIKAHPGAFVVAVVLHVVLFVLLSINLVTSEVHRPEGPKKETVKAVVIDAEKVREEQEKIKRAEEIKQKKKQEQLEKQKREAARAKQELEKEKQRLAELKKKKEDEKKRLAELKKKKEQEEKAREQREAERKKREQEEQKRLEAERKEAERKKKEQERLAREAEERRRAAEQAELKRTLEEEQAARAEAERQDMLKSMRAQYVKMIEQQVERNWIRPATASKEQTCEVYVTQTALGDVINVVLHECASDPVFQRSVESAVRKASPLPPPPSPDVFDREIHFTFRPSS